MNDDIGTATDLVNQVARRWRSTNPDATLRSRLRRVNADEVMLRVLAKGQRRYRKRVNKVRWDRPQCEGITKSGRQCRRGAIVTRETHKVIGLQPLCRLHGGLEALHAYLRELGQQVDAALGQVRIVGTRQRARARFEEGNR